MFGWLFGEKKREYVPAFALARTRGFQQEIVGESHYQRSLTRIVGGKKERSAKHECIAQLICDDQNKFDRNAIEVRISGYRVGYLSKEDAKRFRIELQALDPELPVTAASAKIVGGWRDESSEGHFGVKLNLKWPLKRA